MLLIPIILSGGSGTRLWPLSTSEKPKQFLNLIGDKTMIQQTLLRLNGIKTAAPIISCNETHRYLVTEQIGEFSNEKPTIILEPFAKNTAPAIFAACCAAIEKDNDAVVIVLPSDHIIQNEVAFHKAVEKAVRQAEKGFLVTFGIVPTFPATGYGYIKSGNLIDNDVYSLEKFVEKPDLETAKKYLHNGEYSWNSGMFVFKAKVFIEELLRYEPDMAQLVKDSYKNAKVADNLISLEKSSLKKIRGNSIDYAVMERTDKGMIVKLNAGWNDVGSWSALYDIDKKNSELNVVKGNVITMQTSNSYIRASKRKIAVLGLNNVVIVDSDDAILISAKDKVQDVKKLAEQFQKQ